MSQLAWSAERKYWMAYYFSLNSVPEAPANKTHKILASVVAAHGLFGSFTAQKRIAKQQRDKQLWLISVF